MDIVRLSTPLPRRYSFIRRGTILSEVLRFQIETFHLETTPTSLPLPYRLSYRAIQVDLKWKENPRNRTEGQEH